ncbi:MAG: hypothetical protein U0167_09910 [bacterium]
MSGGRLGPRRALAAEAQGVERQEGREVVSLMIGGATSIRANGGWILTWLRLPLFVGLTALVACRGAETTAPQPNRAPFLSVQHDTSSAVGDTLRLHASAMDPDGDRLRYSATIEVTFDELRSGYRPESDMNGDSGWFWFRASAKDEPSRTMSFFADDGRGGRDSTTFEVAVR